MNSTHTEKKKVLVLGAQVPFVRGGAELLCESLVMAINQLMPNVEADLLQLPFKWYPESQIMKDMLAWRMIDITEANGTPIDLCIPTKFPSYLVRHPNKVTWLVHQHRVFYDLAGSEYDVAHNTDEDRIVRQKVRSTDHLFLRESRSIFTISTTVSDRLATFNDTSSEHLYPPPMLADSIRPGNFGDYILYVGRLEKMKRVDRIIRALTKLPSAKVRIVGTGNHATALQKLAIELGVGNRCVFEGYVDDSRYIDLLANARAVYYGPVDEDYGYATVEGLMARKPVITFRDSGEVARIIEETGAGWICDYTTDALEHCVSDVYALSISELERIADNGTAFARQVSWDNVLNKLVVPFL